MKPAPGPYGGESGTSPFGVELLSFRLGGFATDDLAIVAGATVWAHLSSNSDVSSTRLGSLVTGGVDYWLAPRLAAGLALGALLTDDVSKEGEQHALPALETRLGLALVRTDHNAVSLVVRGSPLLGEDLTYALAAGIEWQHL
jgi:hypothetical protein